MDVIACHNFNNNPKIINIIYCYVCIKLYQSWYNFNLSNFNLSFRFFFLLFHISVIYFINSFSIILGFMFLFACDVNDLNKDLIFWYWSR